MSGEKGGAFFVETSFSLGFDKSYKLYFCVVPERGKLLFRKNRLAKMSAKMFAESVRFVLAECNISVNTSIQVIRMEIL